MHWSKGGGAIYKSEGNFLIISWLKIPSDLSEFVFLMLLSVMVLTPTHFNQQNSPNLFSYVATLWILTTLFLLIIGIFAVVPKRGCVILEAIFWGKNIYL